VKQVVSTTHDGLVDIPDALVGDRVSVRHLVGERDGRPLYSDAVGELSAADSAAVVVSTRRGPVRVERAAVVAVRAVPPAPPRRAPLAAIARLEGLCADAWPTPVDRALGAWRLRAAGGYTGRANAALAIGDPGLPVPDALAEVGRFAREHGIEPRVHAPAGSPWDRAVAGQGWVLDVGHAAGAESAVLVAPLAGAPDPRVELAERPSEEWWQLALGAPPTAAQRHVVDPGGSPRTAFGLLRGASGAALGLVRAAVVADHLHLAMLQVAPSARRQGLATVLLGAVAAWGEEHGARWSVLQVAVHNTGARALYERLGHVEHHRYRDLVPPR
jgi:ribosomal protein S18 acetylase RimI-like enzyme